MNSDLEEIRNLAYRLLFKSKSIPECDKLLNVRSMLYAILNRVNDIESELLNIDGVPK